MYFSSKHVTLVLSFILGFSLDESKVHSSAYQRAPLSIYADNQSSSPEADKYGLFSSTSASTPVSRLKYEFLKRLLGKI